MWDEAAETAETVVSLASHGIPMTMDAWRDMTMRDRASLVRASNEAERARRRAAGRRR